MTKLMTVSHRFKRLFQFLLIFYPLATILSWAFMDQVSPEMMTANTGLSVAQLQLVHFTPFTKTLGLLISFLMTGVVMFGITRFIALFSNYEKGEVFTLENVLYYRKIAHTIFYYVIASLLSKPLISLALTFQNPPHEKMIVASMGSTEIQLLITGGLILLVSWVMQEAYTLAEENAQTI